jgi:hypothetical protein
MSDLAAFFIEFKKIASLILSLLTSDYSQSFSI